MPQSDNEPTQEQVNAVISLYKQGRLKDVVRQASDLIQRFPRTLILYNIIGAAYAGLQMLDLSIASFEKAIQVDANSAKAYNNLGAIQKQQGDIKLAIASYQRALKIDPDFIDAHVNMGCALQSDGSFLEAIYSFENAIKINPQYADAHLSIGNVLQECGQFDDAVSSYEKVLEIQPNHAVALYNMGCVQKRQGHFEEAISRFEAALEIKPDFAVAQYNLANALKDNGNIDEAIECYEKAIKIKSDYADAYKSYATTKTFTQDNDYTKMMYSYLNSHDIPYTDKILVNFAFSKIKIDMGENAKAFEHLQIGNALGKKETGYNISKDITHFKDIKSKFSSKSIQDAKISFADDPKPTPIFILGMPRSGTTLTEQIISSHSDVFGAGELNFLKNAIAHTDHAFNTSRRDAIKKIREEYYKNINNIGPSQRFFTDKMPYNFKWIGFIAAAFPEAKIVHLKRTPAAVCWSNFKWHFPVKDYNYTYDMEDIANYYHLYQDIMVFWHKLFPNKIYDLNYEQLTENQLEETRKLLDYLGLDWEDAVLDFHKNDRRVTTLSKLQVRQKMYKGSSEEWLKFEEYLQPMLKILDQYGSI